MPAKLFVAGVALVCLSFGFVREDSAPVWAGAGGDKEPSKKLTKLYFGVSLCRDCHGKPQAVPNKDALLYRGTEMHVWDKDDKHKDATRVLLGKRSQQIAQNLGWKTDVSKDHRCLSCHGVVVTNEKEVHEESFQPAQRVESGVSCVVCHGEYREWVNEHVLPLGSWKKYTRAEKEQKFGLRDLWDPATRAALCCSCHVGDAAQGKVVTHEMYAAGHPPLPGIEIAAFSDAMPRHWETLSEKVLKRSQHREFYKRVHGFDAERDEVEQARLLAVSSLVALRTSVRLVHDLAKRYEDNPNAKDPTWPELAVFDCYACHHDLKSESWRQLRATKGRPGRPMMRPWPSALAIMASKEVARRGGRSRLETHPAFVLSLYDLAASFDMTPFGEPRTVVKSAADVLARMEKVLEMAQSANFDRVMSRDLLSSILKKAENDLLDFDSARQLGWAMRSLLAPTKADSEVSRHLELLQRQLHLDLLKGQVLIAEEYLPKVLSRIGAYDPREFQKAMRALATEIDKSAKQ